MDNEFLQKIDLDLLKIELGCDVEGIAKMLALSEQTVYKWKRDKSKGGCRPTYNDIITLLKNGASLKALFGIEKTEPQKLKDAFVDPEVVAGIKEALLKLAGH